MIEKLCDIYKKYKLSIIIALVIVLLGILCLTIFNVLKSNSELITLNEENYSLKYDKSWKVKEKSDNYITLNHKSSRGLLKLEVIDLDKDYKYADIEDLMDEIIYNIGEQNKDYKLIAKQETVFSKYEFNGYKLLYETETEQVMIMTYKKSDKLIMGSFKAESRYFDMTLDSVENIFYNFDVAEETFELKNSISTETSEISYLESDELDKLLSDSVEYEIASSNYKVVYEVPSTFKLGSLNSTSNYFSLKNYDKGNITINTNISNKNVYEYLEKDSISGVYKKYDSYKNFSNFEEKISELDSGYSDSYVYKNSYESSITGYNETVELIYSLNKSHILIITIKSAGGPITSKLLDSIKIKSVTNYSSYTKNRLEDGYRVAELKEYIGYKTDKYKDIIIRLPEEYVEIDKKTNLYKERHFGFNYNEDKSKYDYVVHYELSVTNDIEKNLELLNMMFKSSYGECNKYHGNGDNITINGKQFIEYVGGYTDLGGIPFTNINRYKYYVNHKALFYKLNDGSYLIIEIQGNGKKISDDIVNQVTNFESKEENAN